MGDVRPLVSRRVGQYNKMPCAICGDVGGAFGVPRYRIADCGFNPNGALLCAPCSRRYVVRARRYRKRVESCDSAGDS